MSGPTRAEAIAALLYVVVAAAEEVGTTPTEVLAMEIGARSCLQVLGVTDDELAAALRKVAEL